MKLSLFSKFIVLLLVIPSLWVFFFPGKISVISVLCGYPLLVTILLFSPKLLKEKFEGKIYLVLFLLINIILILRGFLDAKSSEDWKVLLSQTFIIYIVFPMMIFFGIKNELVKNLFRTFYKYGILLACILLFTFRELEMYGFPHNIAPILLMLFFIPYLSFTKKIYVFGIIILSFFTHLSMRSNMLNIIIALLIFSTYYIRKFKYTLPILINFRRFILIAPFAFVTLGVTGVFNIFQIGELIGEMNIESDDGKKDNLVVDSRTGIYLDVALELNKEKSFLWGLGGSGKTETYLKDLEWGDFGQIYKEGRRATESGMLNYVQYSGIIGMIIYFLVFVKASSLALKKSNNWICIMIGLWVTYKGVFSFIEDRHLLNLYTPFLALSLGICFNTKLRLMSDIEIKDFVTGIFRKKMIKSNSNIL